MRLPTMKIRNTKDGRTMKINQEDWATDLGLVKYAGWERVGGERLGDEKPIEVTNIVQPEPEPKAEEENVADAVEATTAEKDKAPEAYEETVLGDTSSPPPPNSPRGRKGKGGMYL